MGVLGGNAGYDRFIKRTQQVGAKKPATVDWHNPGNTGKIPGTAPIPNGSPTQSALGELAGTGAQANTPWTRVKDAEAPLVANTLVKAPGPAQGVSNEAPAATPMVRPNAMPAPAATTTFTPPPQSGPDALYDNALGQIADGLQDKPLPGTQAAILQNREALATYAKRAEAAAGAQAVKGGALGQGTANQMAQGVRGDILSELANTELQNTQLVSNEKQALIDKAVQAGQFGQTMDARKNEFSATMNQRAGEFEKTFGANEAGNYRNQLERMAMDNPVLAGKLTDYLLAGNTGAVGSFTPEEKEQIKTFVAKKQGQDDKLTDVMNTIIGAIPGQVAAGTKADADAQKKADDATVLQERVGRMSNLAADKFLEEADFKALEASQDVKRFTLTTIPAGAEATQTYGGKVISIDGKQYKYVKSDNITTSWDSRGILPDKRDATTYVEVVDSSGAHKFIYNGQVHDAPPKKDNNPNW